MENLTTINSPMMPDHVKVRILAHFSRTGDVTWSESRKAPGVFRD